MWGDRYGIAKWNREDAKVAKLPRRHLFDSSQGSNVGFALGIGGTRVNRYALRDLGAA